MTEHNTGPVDRGPSPSNPATATQSNQVPATGTGFTTPDLEPPHFATTDVDPSPGIPRSLNAMEPNFATTDVDPTPRGAPGRHGYGVSGDAAADPAVDRGRPGMPPRGR